MKEFIEVTYMKREFKEDEETDENEAKKIRMIQSKQLRYKW